MISYINTCTGKQIALDDEVTTYGQRDMRWKWVIMLLQVARWLVNDVHVRRCLANELLDEARSQHKSLCCYMRPVITMSVSHHLIQSHHHEQTQIRRFVSISFIVCHHQPVCKTRWALFTQTSSSLILCLLLFCPWGKCTPFDICNISRTYRKPWSSLYSSRLKKKKHSPMALAHSRVLICWPWSRSHGLSFGSIVLIDTHSNEEVSWMIGPRVWV